jgi:hypothetical protein
MTEVKFDTANWFDYNCYQRYLDKKPLRRKLTAIDGVKVFNIDCYEGGRIEAILDMEFTANATIKIDNEERRLWISVKGSYDINYQIETNLSSEDAAKAEQNLKSAIKSGRTVFKVPTVAIPDKDHSVRFWWNPVKVWDNGKLIADEEASKLLEDAMDGKVSDLGEYEFLRDIVPMPKDERIEFICEVPEELLISNNVSKQKFHIEDWINYYKVELDEEDLIDLFDSEDLSKVTSIYFDGETISVDLESDVSDLVYVTRADDETGEEEEHEVEIFADFSYSVDYKIDDLEKCLEDFNEALNEAINKEETTFEIRVPFVAGEAFDLDVDVTEIYNDEVDEDDVHQAAYKSIECGLASVSFEMHHGDSVQPPRDKEILFICTIPTK